MNANPTSVSVAAICQGCWKVVNVTKQPIDLCLLHEVHDDAAGERCKYCGYELITTEPVLQDSELEFLLQFVADRLPKKVGDLATARYSWFTQTAMAYDASQTADGIFIDEPEQLLEELVDVLHDSNVADDENGDAEARALVNESTLAISISKDVPLLQLHVSAFTGPVLYISNIGLLRCIFDEGWAHLLPERLRRIAAYLDEYDITAEDRQPIDLNESRTW